MEEESNHPGENDSGNASSVSKTSKVESFVVSYPLTQSEIDWLKLQSKLVGEASKRFLEREKIASFDASNAKINPGEVRR